MKQAKMDFEVVWSFDHATIHDSWAQRVGEGRTGAAWCNRVELPVHCPDFQKVIEHTFGRFKHLLHGMIAQNCNFFGTVDLSNHQLRALVKEALAEAARPEVIAADVANLPCTLQVIAHAKGEEFLAVKNGREVWRVGSGGDWPTKKDR